MAGVGCVRVFVRAKHKVSKFNTSNVGWIKFVALTKQINEAVCRFAFGVFMREVLKKRFFANLRRW